MPLAYTLAYTYTLGANSFSEEIFLLLLGFFFSGTGFVYHPRRGTQIFSLSHARDTLNIPSFLISSPSLKFTIFLYLSPIGHFDIADPSSMQDACHRELSKYDLCSPRVSQ